MKKLLILVFTLGFLFGAICFAVAKLNQSIESGAVRTFTEEHIQKIFGAKVSVGKVQLNLFQHLALSELKFDKSYLGPHLALTRVQKIVVGYSWRSLFERNFRVPKDVLLESPRFLLEAFDFPGVLYHWNFLHLMPGALSFSMKIDEGMMLWNKASSGLEIGIQHLNGRIDKKGPGEIYVRFGGKLSGKLQGDVSWEGRIAPKTKRADLFIRFKDVEHTSADLQSFKNLNGTLHLKDSTLFVEGMRFSVASLSFQVRGKIENLYDSNPKFSLEIRELSKFGGGEIKLDLNGDFKTQKIQGTFWGFDGTYPFRGDLARDPSGYQIRDMKIGTEMNADMDFSTSDWAAHVKLTRGKERYRVRFSLKDFNFGIDLNADHMQVYDFDIVTAAHMDFKPQREAWNSGNFVFDASLSTDYFIFDYAPFQDFKGRFNLSGEGIRDIRLTWGTGYQTTGEIIFGKPPLVAFDIQASGIVLSKVSHFGFHSLPENLSGMMDGKIIIRGEARQPEISGYLSIGSGSVKELNFDHVLLNFFGNRHYLKLKDSKISKGKRTFYVKGDVDFANKNIFSGIEVVSEDHLPVWSGRDMRMQVMSSPSGSGPAAEKQIPQIERSF